MVRRLVDARYIKPDEFRWLAVGKSRVVALESDSLRTSSDQRFKLSNSKVRIIDLGDSPCHSIYLDRLEVGLFMRRSQLVSAPGI